MFLPELVSEIRELLDDVTPHFNETFRRWFRNGGRYWRHKNADKHRCNDIFIDYHGRKIELSNINLIWLPDFRIERFNADLHGQSLTFAMNLGRWHVESDYEINDAILQKLLPISYNGKILVSFSNVHVTGRVGMIMKEDSFLPINYDLSYDTTDVTVKVNYFDNSGNPIQLETVNPELNDTIGSYIWPQLHMITTDLLQKQLGETVVEVSLMEFLNDRQEELRPYAEHRTSRANCFLDSLLCAAKDRLTSDERRRRIDIPPFDTVFHSRSRPGQFRTAQIRLDDLATLSRHGDASIHEDANTLHVYGTLRLADLHLSTTYEATCVDVAVNGRTNCRVCRNALFVRFGVTKSGADPTVEVEVVRVARLADIEVDVAGLGALTWLETRVNSWLIGHLNGTIRQTLEAYVKGAFQEAVNSMDCLALLVD